MVIIIYTYYTVSILPFALMYILGSYYIPECAEPSPAAESACFQRVA